MHTNIFSSHIEAPHLSDSEQLSISCLCHTPIMDWHKGSSHHNHPRTQAVIKSEGGSARQGCQMPWDRSDSWLPSSNLIILGEWDQLQDTAMRWVLPCTMGTQKGKRNQGQTRVWEGFPGGSGDATLLMKRRSGKAETQTFLEVGGGLSTLWHSAFAFLAPCPLTADVDSPGQRVNGREASLGTFST